MKKKRLVIFSSLLPLTIGNKEAANVILHQIINFLLLKNNYEIYYCLISDQKPENNQYSENVCKDLKEKGLLFKDPLLVQKKRVTFFKFIYYFLFNKPNKIFSGSEVQNKIYDHLGFKPDLVLAIWSELATHACAGLDCKKFNYSGNNQYDVYAAHYELKKLSNKLQNRKLNLINKIEFSIKYRLIKYAYIFAMKKYDLVWNVANNNAKDLFKNGVKVKYLQNMWPIYSSNIYFNNPKIKKNKKIKITANVGNMNATGNSIGLYILASEILPKLKELLEEGSFEFHLFGRGEPFPFLKKILNDPHIKIRGFVKDLDREIINSDIFLVANNSKRFKVGHTRFLHAWSLSSCVVAFQDSALAMPEIKHEYNALLANNSNELCEYILKCINDKKLRSNLGKNGFKTLNKYFDPKIVTSKIHSDIILLTKS